MSLKRWLVWTASLELAFSLIWFADPPRVLPVKANYISNYQGFDSCAGAGVQPTAAQMDTWWRDSPFYDFYVYLGGSWAACQPGSSGISSSWFSTVRTNNAWGLVGIWVGPQCCGSGSLYISTNTTTARSQGAAQANLAYSQLASFGVVDGNFPMVYDIESNSNTAAVQAFLGGWVQQWHNNGFLWAGAYGSVCGSNVNSWRYISPTPDFVWTADYQSPLRNTVWGLQCLSDGLWSLDERHNQYHGTHTSSYGSVAISIDTDCANGQVWGAVYSVYGTYGDSDAGGETYGATEDDSYWCPGGVL